VRWGTVCALPLVVHRFAYRSVIVAQTVDLVLAATATSGH
jgi:hypothetical protein